MIPLRPSLLRRPREALVCTQCLFGPRYMRPEAIRGFLSSSKRRTGTADDQSPSVFHKSYFSANRFNDGSSSKGGLLYSLAPSNAKSKPTASSPSDAYTNQVDSSATASSAAIATEATAEELPHRRRKRLKEERNATAQPEQSLPLDASAQLSNFSSTLPATSLRRRLAAYLALTKPRLSFLIVLTTTSAYGMYPISSLLTLDPAMTPLPTLSTSTLTFIYLTVGTFLSCCSANTLNMMFEPKFDALMSRTRNRPLVRGLVSRRGALFFAIGTAVAGLSLLYVGTNPTTTALSAANIFLYAFVYTPLKRMHVINTWVGAVVGGIPPLMGWIAAAGQTATMGHDTWRDMLFSEQSIGGWLLGGILFAWQFPHFNALSHLIRDEYKAAGYRMLCWVNPARSARVALRYSILMFPISIGLWWVNVVGSGFLVGSTVANGWLVHKAYYFWQHQGANGTARGLFWASIWQLPILLVGGLVTKKGLWDGVWRNIFGQADEEDDEYLYYEDEEEFEDKKAKVQDAASSRAQSIQTSTLSTA
ncbi:Protohem IX farnesyltransferase mitochondria [Penicillium cf. griseofulvum]|uniref:Protoheme IX farnesyltransferase, mitochondrial n=1 Tax=Penicillium cf. griseofulvum TaxID=2972120 RepID=A0A9W9MSY2_9EURO|nr:Protohem IX farnesyltransferase mitochondria [Penicillium cf. griseofulvum]KAJ5448110.1 Protohem IX farnesyltransferase mitochondria [Penicillium cf. griseofulvum]